MQRMLKQQGDYVGRALARRAGLVAPERLQLVGVRPLDRSRRLRNGTQLVAAADPSTSLGYVTSSTPSAEQPGWLGLALLTGGRARIGQRVLGVSPVYNEATDIEIVSPHHSDPGNTRVRA